MSNPTAAALAAAAARHTVQNPTTTNLIAAHRLLKHAQQNGATDTELRTAARTARLRSRAA